MNPIATIAIAHGIWDPHFASALSGKSGRVLLSSGISHWLYTLGFKSLFQLYNFLLLCEFLAVISIALGKLHLISHEEFWFWLRFKKPISQDIKVHALLKSFLASFDLARLRLNFHTGMLIGFLSLAWSGHLVD